MPRVDHEPGCRERRVGSDVTIDDSDPRSQTVKYMLLIYQNTAEWSALTEAEVQAVMSDVDTLMAELTASGEWVGGEGLLPATDAKIVRVRNGVPAVTDGPFAEAKEQMVGYCIVDCATQERAVEIAARWPDARYWAMEVRPMHG
jgi:hypothetical protein